MSNEENENNSSEQINNNEPKAAEQVQNKLGNFIAIMLDLKENKPKVFYGLVGGVILVLLFVMMSGDGGTKSVTTENKLKNIAVGQQYVLKSANTYDEAATIRLVSDPGEIKAFDDTEETDRKDSVKDGVNTTCQHIKQGTPVTVLKLTDAYGTKNAFAEVQIIDGPCKGKTGWALSIDIQ
jgi:hypothetical protein